MKRNKILVIGALGMLLTCGYLVASAPSKSTIKKRKLTPQVPVLMPREALIPTPEQVAKFQGDNNDPARLYTIEPAPIRAEVKARTPQEDKLFEQATAIMLRERPVPPDRVQFFKSVDEGDFRFKICGWSAFVYNVTPIPGGWGIRLKVWPKVTADAQIANSYYEEYTWADGVLTYVKGYGNPKTSGKMVHW